MKFLTRSLLILFFLYGLVFAVSDMYLVRAGAPVWLALAFPIALFLVQYLMGPWIIEMILDISWTGMQLPDKNREFVEKLCADRGLKVPRIGIIHSGTPNAFSFGRVRTQLLFFTIHIHIIFFFHGSGVQYLALGLYLVIHF